MSADDAMAAAAMRSCLLASVARELRRVSSRPSRHRARVVPVRWRARCQMSTSSSVEVRETESFGDVDAQHRILRLHAPRADVHYVVAGDDAAPAVLMLHGFPDNHATWRGQIPPLVEAGYRIICPDLRGYGRSGKPAGVDSYGPVPVTDDLAALLEHERVDTARAVVGHDWGAAVAYAFAARHHDKLEKLSILNGVHPSIFLEHVLSNPVQFLKSYYIGFFQLPMLPEAVVSAADFAILRLIFEVDPASPLPKGEVDKLIEACGRPGAMQAALNYYRAAGPMHNLWNDVGVCRVPLQVQWGAKDRYLEEKIAIPNTDEKEFAPLAVPSSLVRHPNATHWVQWDEPEAVSDALIEFLNDE